MVKSALTQQLQNLFKQPPFSESDCANAWAQAMVAYTTPIVPPSTGQAAAGTAMASALQGMSASAAAPDLLVTAIASFAQALTSTMPPSAAAIAPLKADLQSSLPGKINSPSLDGDQIGSDVADAIDTWMKTGTYTIGTTPGNFWS